MTKKRNIFIASLFAIAVGTAFTAKSDSAKFLGNWQKTSACPSVALTCPKSSGIICSNIFLDASCSVQAYRQ